MAITELIMPKLGESIMEATVLRWHKRVGDHVKQDETILDIATDKVDSEVPSTASGIITELLFKENDVVPIGAIIARIEVDSANAASVTETTFEQGAEPQPETPSPLIIDTPPQDVIEEIPYTPLPKPNKSNGSNNNRFFSPLVLNIANSEGISLSELENITGSGAEGRVSKKDILQYIADKKTGKVQEVASKQTIKEEPFIQVQQPAYVPPAQQEQTFTAPVEMSQSTELARPNIEIIEMDRMRKLIAKHMVDSKHTSAHVTSFAEADVTNMVLWRDKIKNDFEKREGMKITFTPMFIECLVKVMQRFPIINSSVEGDRITIKKFYNIGMATALPDGNLIVPVIKNAEQQNLVGLTRTVNGLADKARNNKLNPDDVQGGTFTLTNVGTFGSLMGTPIINQPQVAILAVGIIKKKPVVIETDKGDFVGIRHMMYLSLSYDHRIIDGSVGAGFLTEVAKEFEKWDVNRELKLVVKEHYEG